MDGWMDEWMGMRECEEERRERGRWIGGSVAEEWAIFFLLAEEV